jgi:replicative DNA helicase
MDRISNPIVQSYYLKKLAKTLDVEENNIRLMMGKYKFKTRKPEIYRTIEKKLDTNQRNTVIQKYVLSLVLQNHSIINRVFSIIDTHDFSIVSYQKIANLFISFVNENKQVFDINRFINLLPKELIPVFDETYLYSAHDLGLENQKIEKLAYEIKRDSLKRQISSMLKLESDDQKQNEKLKELNLQLKEVEKKHSSL